jgi:hypothetical protein
MRKVNPLQNFVTAPVAESAESPEGQKASKKPTAAQREGGEEEDEENGAVVVQLVAAAGKNPTKKAATKLAAGKKATAKRPSTPGSGACKKFGTKQAKQGHSNTVVTKMTKTSTKHLRQGAPVNNPTAKQATAAAAKKTAATSAMTKKASAKPKQKSKQNEEPQLVDAVFTLAQLRASAKVDADGKLTADAFTGDKTLRTMVLPIGITSIEAAVSHVQGTGAFSNCTNLISITFSASTTSIGGNAFRGCCSLATIAFPE